MPSMKAAIVTGDGRVGVRNIRRPEPGPYECLCRILACATCTGTDSKIIEGKFPFQNTYPGILGHESVARVVAKGKNVRFLKEGQVFLRVCAGYPGASLDRYASFWGGFAEYGLVTDVTAMLEDDPKAEPPSYCASQQEVPVEAGIAAADATMLIPLKEIASIVTGLQVAAGQSLVVLGAGTVAMAVVFFAKLVGAAPVIAIGRRAEVGTRMRGIGADLFINNSEEDPVERIMQATGGRGCDFVVDAAGDEKLFAEATRFLALRGTLAPYAVTPTGGWTFPGGGPNIWHMTRVRPLEATAHQQVIELAKQKRIPFRRFYSHRMTLDRIAEAFDLLRRKEAFKVVIEMQ